nr:hypothetical protein [Tanacetum cinerariifolium]
MRSVKMVLGDDTRWMELPVNCSIELVREIKMERYPGLDGVLIKLKYQEGDFVTILTTSKVRVAEELCAPQAWNCILDSCSSRD